MIADTMIARRHGVLRRRTHDGGDGGGARVDLRSQREGQLGVGDTAERLGFTQVDAGQLGGARIVMAACGWCHSVVVSAEGRVWTFGNGEFGRLGHTDDDMADGLCLVPTLVAVFEGSKIVTVAAGERPHHGRGSERHAVGVGQEILRPAGPGLGTWYLVVAYRGNGGIHRGIYQLQGDDNGHVGRPR